MATASASLDFDGTNDNVSYGDITIYDGLSEMTNIMWMNMDVVTSGTKAFWRKESSVIPFMYQDGAAQKIRSPTWPGPASNRWTYTMPTNEWHQFATTWNKDTNSGYTTLYVDTVSQGNSSTTQTNTLDNSSVGMYMGTTAALAEDVDGREAWAISFDRELSAEEVQEVFFNPYSVPNGVIASWNLIDGGSTQYDKSGNGNNGTVSGATPSTDGPPVFLLGGQ
jgi:hypothetical protein